MLQEQKDKDQSCHLCQFRTTNKSSLDRHIRQERRSGRDCRCLKMNNT